MNKELLKKIILENKELAGKIKPLLHRGRINLPQDLKKVILLYGVRRSGKTYILYDLFRENLKNSLYIDFEDDRICEFKLKDFDDLKEAFYELYPDLLDKEKYFFLDEIQNVEGWEKICRRAVEKENIKVFVAGSSSKFSPEDIHTSLRGREWSIEITPFSFKEYLDIINIPVNNEYLFGPKNTITKNLFQKYMKWGGFPEIVLSDDEFQKNKLLREYFRALFFRDLVERYDMANISLIGALADKLFSSFACRMSLNAFYKQYKDKFPFSKDSLYEYYRNFISSMLIYEVKIFSESTYKRHRNPSKIYLPDTGLARRATSEDSGRLLENMVFLKLRKENDEVFYFSNDSECDFVTKKDNKFSAVQVCYYMDETNRDREIHGLAECCRHLNLKKGKILTNDQEDNIKEKGIDIRMQPVWKWLLEEAR
ncbi:MAG: ATP-binding protein [Elusimicrobiota bacterium]